MATFSEQPQQPVRQRSFGLVIFIILMILANIWLFQKTFDLNRLTAFKKNKLPQLNLNLFSASSFIIKNSSLFNIEPPMFGKKMNILVLGKSGSGYIAPDLTDTILLARLDGPAKKIKIVSLPRDLAVKTSDGKSAVKINSLYQLGLKNSEKEGLRLIKEKVEEMSGFKIDNFILFDLKTVEKIIDAVGGVNVNVKNDIYDPSFPNDRGSYTTFQLKSGYRYLDGQTALRFIRTRHSPQGDFDRIERQQEVLKALKGKLTSLNPFWDFSKLWNIFRTVQKNVRTDLTISELKNIWSLAKTIELDTIETFILNSSTGLIIDKKVRWDNQIIDILAPVKGSYDYIDMQTAIKDFLTR